MSEYPTVSKTEAASPMPLPRASRTDVTIPGITWRTITLNAVSSFVAPREKDASLKWAGTVRITSSIPRITIGRMSNATVMMPQSKDARAPRISISVNAKAP